MRPHQRLLAFAALAGSAACTATVPAGRRAAELPTVELAQAGNDNGRCEGCEPGPTIPLEVTSALHDRIADLKERGGFCSRYATVMEESYRQGRITIRPYMWRVGGRLTSGEARPNGEMTLARDIDSLNVGVRTLDDLMWTMEHEAAHIAFNVVTGVGASEDRANPYVRACRSQAAVSTPLSR